jgi:hypothetical protein
MKTVGVYLVKRKSPQEISKKETRRRRRRR